MPRRNHDRKANRRTNGSRDSRPDSLMGGARIESGPSGWSEEEFTTRTVPGNRATKTYRCPGCDHEIRPGVSHVVAWPAAELGGPDNRRHWHSGCWSGRATRGLTRRWS
ncbi:ATP/GTP-binding protein [Rhodococcoides fascians]|uniref:ATP/GTP-binding protein n=1 Tax=Rhodococcoides fascians TaxID=1828 RepID=UPI0009B8AB6A|nr:MULTISPECIES: ATP/GTP-binding protein [Rhodococcus]